ncbi:Peptide-N(4)-(N-acetyl-beta-glucosaminyl)asparagine amidase-like protein [Drosera capensis]
MVARQFAVRFNDADFDVDYDTDDGLEVFKYQLFSLTSIPPDQQKIVSGDEDDRVVVDDSDLVEISDKIRLVSIGEEGLGTSGGESGIGSEKLSGGFEMSDEELARMLQAEEEALLLQQYVAEEDNGQMERRIRPYIGQVMMYEDPNYQEAARKTVPTDELEEKALIALAKEGNFAPTINERDHAFLLQLLLWFKKSFSWVHSPSCETCGSETINEGMGDALDSEKQYGGYRVELYRSCSRITRFPRYNDPLKLLETRRGRCGEWANCFTLYCRTLGYDSRLILDFTDHVWTECFSNHLGRWMHLDPCEGIHDKPLLYEKGWNKKLDYVIAIANDGVYDVTKRYTRKWHEVLLRRSITTEDSLSSILTNLTKERRKGFPADLLLTLEGRDRNERGVLERTAHGEDDTSVSLPGRLSGNKEWRISRSECGESDSFSSSNCPVRQCVDAHVTQIYNAFSPFLAEFVDNHHSMSKAIDALKIFKDLLKDLKNSPYASRRASIKPVPVVSKFIVRNMLQSFVPLLNALHLKHESTSSGEVVITLANDPVKTSLALPVAFDAVVNMIQTLKNSGEISKDSFSLPTMRLNRIHSGSVLASGEELPFGIATSAFDGIRLSKWEEPSGAKGAWIVYKLADDKKCELVAYEFMSANDAPERDPMDWVVEGSDDGGSSWHIIDKQTSQKFEGRFQRKTCKVTSSGVESNTFRFRFLAVRDAASTSRLQIGSIDLYSHKA